MVMEQVVSLLETIGFFNYILPFLLVFVIIYSILRLTKIFGDPKDAGSANAIISLVVALFIFYFGRIYQLGPFFSFFLSRGAIYIIIFVLAAVIANFLDKAFVENILSSADAKQKLMLKAFIFFLTLVVVYAALSSSPFVGPIVFGTTGTAAFSADMLVSILVLLLLAGLIYFIVVGA